jgi:hypothetical protein
MKVDTKLVSAGLAEVERMLEEGVIPNEDGRNSAFLRIVVDCIGGEIKEQHSRFNRGEFESESTPISSERLKQAIITKFGGMSS